MCRPRAGKTIIRGSHRTPARKKYNSAGPIAPDVLAGVTLRKFEHVPFDVLVHRIAEKLCWECGEALPPSSRKLCSVCRLPPAKAPRTRLTWKELDRNRRARVAGASGSATKEQLAARWEYYQGRCWMCGGAANVFDHVKPLARGGSNWPSNQRPACWRCNRRKGPHWPYPTRLVTEPRSFLPRSPGLHQNVVTLRGNGPLSGRG